MKKRHYLGVVKLFLVIIFLSSSAWAVGNTSDGAGANPNNTGNYNSAFGYYVLNNPSGSYNTGIGARALQNNTTGEYNTANGYRSLCTNKSGKYNTANGYNSLYNNTASYNTANGSYALYSNTEGYLNTANGFKALYYNETGKYLTAIGSCALFSNTSGIMNTAVGYKTLFNNETGYYNTAIGYQAGYNNVSGSSNVFIGYKADFSETGSNKLYIENSTTSTYPLIYGDFSLNRVGINTSNPQGTLDVNGSIYQRGGVIYSDYVFEPDYMLESIEEHAEFMWKNKHLKAISKAMVDKNGQEFVEIGAHRRGILEELEKAHIYIEQIHKRLVNMENELTQLKTESNS